VVAEVLDDFVVTDEVGTLEPVTEELQTALCLGVRVRPGVGEDHLTDEAGAVAHVHLQRIRPRSAGRPGDPYLVRAYLLQTYVAEVGGDVGGQVVGGVHDLVHHLLTDRADIDSTAGAWG